VKKIEDVKLGEVFGDKSIWTLIARKQILGNEDWYVVMALDRETNVYGIGRMRVESDTIFGHYTPDFIEAVQCFLEHFEMSVKKEKEE